MPLLKENPYYTYADFLEWDEDFRAEIIDGEIVMMSPPFRLHQGVSGNLFLKLRNFLEGKPCKVYAAPFGVRLFPKTDNSDDTVVEPDIVVICDPKKLDERGCNGAPDLVVEILSPSTARYDRIVKFRKYQKAGVREYWIVDPDEKTLQVCLLASQPGPKGFEKDGYLVTMYAETDTAPVSVLPGCTIPLPDLFAE
jgi:Uma2 family endonuclease